jgi:hypothetical protein
VSDDVRHVLACCERLVDRARAAAAPAAGGDPDAALVEALWTSALLAYARAFAPQAGVLTTADLEALGLPGDVVGFHDLLLRLREQYGSADANPRERCSVGVVEGDDGEPRSAWPCWPRRCRRWTRGRPAARATGLRAARQGGPAHGAGAGPVLQRARALSREELAALPLVRADP